MISGLSPLSLVIFGPEIEHESVGSGKLDGLRRELRRQGLRWGADGEAKSPDPFNPSYLYTSENNRGR